MERRGQRPVIGIITGSGPEAGLDMWSKLLLENRRHLGSAFRGDIDAPEVIILSNPRLGLSMELARHEVEVWDELRQNAIAIAGQVDMFAIACNTLNFFAPRIRALALSAKLVSFPDVVAEYLKTERCSRVCLLGALPVVELGPWSPYASLRAITEFEPVKNTEALHQLIYGVKQLGSEAPTLRPDFEALLSGIESDVVLLACTELPLIADVRTNKALIDVTQLVARELAVRALVRK